MLLQELTYAFRILRNNPGFTAVAICSLGIGIGATSAIYSFADALILRPLPVPEPSRVMSVTQASSATYKTTNSISYPDYLDLRDSNHSFEGVTAIAYKPFAFAPNHTVQPHMKYGSFVSGNFFEVMHVTPQQGRFIRRGDDLVPGRDPVVVLSPDLWESEFNRDPSICGRTIWLNGIEFTVIGIAPDSFPGIGQFKPALYVPLAMSPALLSKDNLSARDVRWLDVKGRLKPGITAAQASTDIEAISSALRTSFPATDQNLYWKLRTEFQLRAERAPPDLALLVMLSWLGLCVLLVACANVTGLLLSRASVRAREMAVRLAIGAGRFALIRQLLLENLLLALAGGVAGVFLAEVLIEIFGTIPTPSDIPYDFTLYLDQRVLLFTVAAAVLSTFLFGLTPALASTRVDLIGSLKERDATTSKKHRLWGRNAIVAGQVTLSVVLLIVSVVLLRGFRSQIDQGPGFRTTHIQTMSFDPALVRYNPVQQKTFYDRLLDLTRQSPEVSSAALASSVPMALGSALSATSALPEGHTLRPGEEPLSVMSAIVSDHYFATMAIPILKGREFLKSDLPDAPLVAIVNEQFARLYWPNQNPVGKKIELESDPKQTLQVIGIAKTVKYFWITEAPHAFLYLPFAQHPRSSMAILTQSKSQDAATLAPVLRHIVQTLDQNMPVFEVRTMYDIYEQHSIATPRILANAVSSLGLMGLVLSVIGLYGTVSYSVSRRTREFAIRIALGADRSKVMRMVFEQGLALGAAGLIVGTVAAIFATRAVTSIVLFAFPVGVAPFVWVSLALLLTIAAAGFLPARRASMTDPVRSLREE